MRSGVCTKCGRTTVFSGRDVPVKASVGNRIPIDFQNSVPMDNYVCTSCGYVERYISDKNGLQQISTKWAEAGKNKRKR